MSARASFVIPVLNEQAEIAGLLSALRLRFPASELIVVDGGSSDATVSTAMPLCDQLLLSERGRAAQMNMGGRVASSAYIFFLHADSVPGITAAELDRQLSLGPQWGFCRVRLSGSKRAYRVIEWCMNRRSQLTSVATGDQMLFLEKHLFESTGGFDAIPLMEDVAYCKRLRALAKPQILLDRGLTSSRRWEEGGIIKTVLRMWMLRLGYVAGVAPQTLWRHYYGQ
jgi:rSAM/selenodomain-associated transferase 2